MKGILMKNQSESIWDSGEKKNLLGFRRESLWDSEKNSSEIIKGILVRFRRESDTVIIVQRGRTVHSLVFDAIRALTLWENVD